MAAGLLFFRPMESLKALLQRLGRAGDRLRELRDGRRLFLVGGAVRDALLERGIADQVSAVPVDFDFAVSGSGLEFARAFADRVHGKLVVLSAADDEVRVVFRGRVFDFNGFGDRAIHDDLARRDFTINAMACELADDGPGELLDPFGGQDDLRRGVIRPVSEGALRSDPLRLLRAFRLGLELGLAIDEAVFEQGRAITLTGIAGERIGGELLRILERPGSYDVLVKLHELGRLRDILPAFEPVLNDDKLRRHSFRTFMKIEEIVTREPTGDRDSTSSVPFFTRFEPEWECYFDRWDAAEPEEPGLPFRRGLLKLAGLLHDIAKPETRFVNTEGATHFYGHDSHGARIAAQMVRARLRLSRAQVKMLQSQVQEHMRLHLLATSPELSDKAIRRFFRDLGPEAFGLMILCYADGWATAGRTFHLEDTITRMIEQKREEDARVSIERFVTGNDLIVLGLKPGPAFKVILQELEDLQRDGTLGSRTEAIEYLKSNLPGLTGSPSDPGDAG